MNSTLNPLTQNSVSKLDQIAEILQKAKRAQELDKDIPTWINTAPKNRQDAERRSAILEERNMLSIQGF